eukprot:1302329-Pleurochrysis_carterae.AAC.2
MVDKNVKPCTNIDLPRAPAPCRPSKLRLDVEAQRSCMPSLSAFIARHMEQPVNGCQRVHRLSSSTEDRFCDEASCMQRLK